jgi:hypothetical protein
MVLLLYKISQTKPCELFLNSIETLHSLRIHTISRQHESALTFWLRAASFGRRDSSCKGNFGSKVLLPNPSFVNQSPTPFSFNATSSDGPWLPDAAIRAPAAEPIFHTVGGHTFLNMPMLHVGAMLRNGQYVRYNAGEAGLGKQTGNAPANHRKLGDATQTTCSALLLVSRQGVIYAHIPPYLCPWMGKSKPAKPKVKAQEAEWKKHKDEWERLTSATKKTFNEYKPHLGNYKAHIIMGHYSRPNEAQQMMNEVFGEKSASGAKIDLDMNVNDLSRLVLVDQTVNPPVIHVGNSGSHTIPGV